MRSLSKEERARKFGNIDKGVGLRSRGHEKLTLEEQKNLFNKLGSQSASTKLDQLRILREAIRSTEGGTDSRDFELTVYEESVKECIKQHQFEAVPYMLAHINEMTRDSLWMRLYVVSLSNTKKFNQAYLMSQSASDIQYASSVVNCDKPLWQSLVDEEEDSIVRTLMEELNSYWESYTDKLSFAVRGHKSHK